MQRKYSYIYSKLVTSDNDFIGIVAYALYKKDKVKFIADFKYTHGIDPTEADLESFTKECNGEYALIGLRTKAEQTVNAFAKSLLKQEIDSLSPEIVDSVLKGKQKEVEDIYKKKISEQEGPWQWKSFISGALQSVLGTIIFLFLLYLLFVVAKGYKLPAFFPES